MGERWSVDRGIKRYSAGDIAVATRKGNINVDDQYIRVDHAIAAGVLVPVPDGDACEYWRKGPGFCLLDNKLCGNSTEIAGKFDRVQPVRLVPIAEAELRRVGVDI